MQISKQRLIQIIKEELQIEDTAGNPLYPAKELRKGLAIARAGDINNIQKNVVDMISGLNHNDAVDLMMSVAEQLGLNPPTEEPESPETSYGNGADNIGFVTTRENIEEMIAAELMDLVKK